MGPDALFADGVIVVDKPAGPTSHDVVAVARRATHVKKVGHTGTLDPLASGVLPLVLGKATRLAQFLSSAEKEYEADIELGVSTTTFDRAGQAVERSQAARPVSELTRSDVEAAVAEFRGTFLQAPPLFSAKKVDGDRAYDLARQHEPVTLRPAEVSAHALDIIEWSGARLRLRLVCSAGFYVRSLAQAIGERLGTGAHLARLVRTRSGDFTLDSAISLADLDQRPGEAAARVIPLHHLLPWLPALTLTMEGASLASRGGFISAGHLDGPQVVPDSGKVRLMHPDGRLLAIAERQEGGGSPLSALLHPGVVLE
jgi:tRNA pseudouridine55 synthase